MNRREMLIKTGAAAAALGAMPVPFGWTANRDKKKQHILMFTGCHECHALARCPSRVREVPTLYGFSAGAPPAVADVRGLGQSGRNECATTGSAVECRTGRG